MCIILIKPYNERFTASFFSFSRVGKNKTKSWVSLSLSRSIMYSWSDVQIKLIHLTCLALLHDIQMFSIHPLPDSRPSQVHIQSTPPIPSNPPHQIPLIPIHSRIKPHQCLDSHPVSLPHQQRYINVQRTVWFPALKQLLYRRQSRGYGVCRTPGRLQKIETNLASFEVDVWVADWSIEGYRGRGEGVGWWDGYGEEPAAACM